MDARTIGFLFSGFMVRLYAAGMALYCASTAADFISTTFKGLL